MLSFQTAHPWLASDNFSLDSSLRPAAWEPRYRQTEQKAAVTDRYNTSSGYRLCALTGFASMHHVACYPGVYKCVYVRAETTPPPPHAPPALWLAQHSDHAGDRPRAPFPHCSHHWGMLGSQEQNIFFKNLSHCAGNVIIARALKNAPLWASSEVKILFCTWIKTLRSNENPDNQTDSITTNASIAFLFIMLPVSWPKSCTCL